EAEIDGATEIEEKWRLVMCVASHEVYAACLGRPDLTWTDLSYANLRGSDLQGLEMTGVDLRFADLTDAELQGAVLRVADLAYAKLPVSFKLAVSDGALESYGLSGDAGAKVMLRNHWTSACLEGPATAANPSQAFMSFPCAQIPDR